MSRLHTERHNIGRIGWLRAAVLGANDGIVSTASLVIGIAAASAGKPAILLAGFAGLAAGALSMAAGEYVSVSSQSDTEEADLAREKKELESQPDFELDELTAIYVERGLDQVLAREVAEQLTAHDALAAHSRDELSITALTTARPLQAAIASAATFTVGAALPLLVVLATPRALMIWSVGLTSLLFLALLGVLGARGGGSPLGKAVLRVVFWGALAMAVTAGVGAVFGATA
jgi:VIT1/CCC1 family predicted Fe2+/Mn2+ transporter